MKLDIVYDDISSEIAYKLVIPHYQLVRMKLRDFDRRLIDECEASNKISDKLLALELIARRIEEAQAISK